MTTHFYNSGDKNKPKHASWRNTGEKDRSYTHEREVRVNGDAKGREDLSY